MTMDILDFNITSVINKGRNKYIKVTALIRLSYNCVRVVWTV